MTLTFEEKNQLLGDIESGEAPGSFYIGWANEGTTVKGDIDNEIIGDIFRQAVIEVMLHVKDGIPHLYINDREYVTSAANESCLLRSLIKVANSRGFDHLEAYDYDNGYTSWGIFTYMYVHVFKPRDRSELSVAENLAFAKDHADDFRYWLKNGQLVDILLTEYIERIWQQYHDAIERGRDCANYDRSLYDGRNWETDYRFGPEGFIPFTDAKLFGFRHFKSNTYKVESHILYDFFIYQTNEEQEIHNAYS